MNENKMSEFESLEDLTEFFDNNDMGQYFDEMPPVHFDVNIQRRSFLVAVDKQLMQQLVAVARAEHISTEQLVNSWLKEKTAQAA